MSNEKQKNENVSDEEQITQITNTDFYLSSIGKELHDISKELRKLNSILSKRR